MVVRNLSAVLGVGPPTDFTGKNMFEICSARVRISTGLPL